MGIASVPGFAGHCEIDYDDVSGFAGHCEIDYDDLDLDLDLDLGKVEL